MGESPPRNRELDLSHGEANNAICRGKVPSGGPPQPMYRDDTHETTPMHRSMGSPDGTKATPNSTGLESEEHFPNDQRPNLSKNKEQPSEQRGDPQEPLSYVTIPHVR